MLTVETITKFLEQFAPLELAEAWDNVGLLVGDRNRSVNRVMTCLTVTPASAAEAVAEKADLIVTHHPLMFQPINRITTDTTEGRLLLELIAAGISIYSPHTAFDSTHGGINERLAEALQLTSIAPLEASEIETSDDKSALGTGRWGILDPALTLAELGQRVKNYLAIDRIKLVGDPDGKVKSVGVACGSAGQLLASARRIGCDCLVLGETNFHTVLEAEAVGVGLLLTGHFASERFAIEHLADVLAKEFPKLKVWASRQEKDPIRWI